MTSEKPALPVQVASFEEAKSEGRCFAASEAEWEAIIGYYRKQELHTQALEATEDALLCFPDSLALALSKAHALIALRREAAALRWLSAMPAGKRCFQAALLEAKALANMGRFEQALDLLYRLREKKLSKNHLADTWAAEALVHEKLRNLDAAFACLRTALELQPDHPDALLGIAACVNATQRYKESASLHEHILDARPFCSRAWYNLGQAYAYLGKYEDALASFEFAFLTDPAFEAAYLEYGEMCFALGQTYQALQCFEEMLEHFEPTAEVYAFAGKCCLALQDLRQALRFFKLSLALDPFDDEVFFQAGICYMECRRWDKAARYLTRAIRLDPFREDYHLALAQVLAQLGAAKKADNHYKIALKLTPDDDQYTAAYARFLLHIQDNVNALSLLEKAAQVETASMELQYLYLAALFAAGRQSQALYLLEEIPEVHPEGLDLLREWAPELLLQYQIKKATLLVGQ